MFVANGLRGRVACVLPTTHQLCPLWSSLCFSDSRSHQGRWRPSLASARGASAAVLVSAVLVWAVVLVKLELYAGTVGESTTASGAAAALDATAKNHSMHARSPRAEDAFFGPVKAEGAKKQVTGIPDCHVASLLGDLDHYCVRCWVRISQCFTVPSVPSAASINQPTNRNKHAHAPPATDRDRDRPTDRPTDRFLSIYRYRQTAVCV